MRHHRTRSRLVCEALENRLLFSLPPAWTSVGAGGGGSFFEPSFNPNNSNEIWVATDQSDEYHSTNGGTSWAVPSFTAIQGNHEAPVQYTSTASLLYGLGPSNYPEKSVDGGQTWTYLPNNPASNADSFIVNYNNPNQFFISSYSQIFFTNDGGTTYTTLNTSSAYVAGAYFNGSNIYLATDQGVISSSNGGVSFSSSALGAGIPTGDGIFSFAGSTEGGVTKFFAVTATDSDIYPGQEGNICYSFTGVISLTAGQTSWTAVDGIPAGADPAFVSMTPGDINDVTLAGGSSAGAPTVVKSADSGASWTNLFDTTNNANIQTGWQGYGGVDYGWGYGEFAMGFAQNPGNPAEMMITDEGGAYLSTNGGTSWHAVYVSPADLNPAGLPTPTDLAYQGNGMENTSAWDLTFTGPSTMLASFTDITGISSTNGGSTWSFNDNHGNSYNTTYQIVSQPVAGGANDLYAAVSDTHDIYQWDAYWTNDRIDAGNGAVLISTNGGSSWSMLHNFNHPVVWEEIDPNHPDTMYVSVANSTGAGGIYMTSDLQDGASSVWKQLPAPPRTEGHPLDIVVLNDGTLVVTYTGTLNDDGTLDDSSGVFVSSNQGTTWTDVTAGTGALQYFDRDITIDPNDPTQSTWFVGTWAIANSPYYPGGGLFETTNRGKTWAMIGGLPDAAFTSVAFNPSNTNEMYITTGSDGLFHSADAESATPTITQVANYPFYAPTQVFFNPYNPSQVWVTSFGYGLVAGTEPSGSGAITWTGAADGINWSNAGNWSDDQVPTQSNTVTIPAGFAAVQVGAMFSVGAVTAASPLDILAAGALKLYGASTLNSAGTVAALTINTGGTLDMGSNSLTINYAAGIDPVAAIRGYLKSAYNGGVWTGAGLTSSAVEAEVAAIGSSGRGMWGIGYADGSVDTKQTVAVGNQLVLEPALTGDADLNGAVNFLDLGIAAQNLGMVNGDWEHGDFNYDGNVNFLDVALLAQNLDETGINTPLSAVTPASELVGTAAVLTWELTAGLPPVAAGSAPGAVAAVASPPNGAEEAMFAVWPNSTAAPDGLFGNVSLANILK